MPCKDRLKGTCADPSCEKWHSPVCLFYKTKEGCKVREKVRVRTQPGLGVNPATGPTEMTTEVQEL